MRFEQFDLDDHPNVTGGLDQEVFIILQQYGATRLHDALLCQAYHLIYDDWQYIQESPNHWVVGIPENRVEERSDASIVRARRSVDDRLHEPNLPLESYIQQDWGDEGDWESYLAVHIHEALAKRYGSDIFEHLTQPEMQKEQVAWLLNNHPETRGSDKGLILQWNEVFGGWKKGGGEEGRRRYAIPKAYQWQQTTPESITAGRRKWQQQGLFLPDESTQARRKELEQEVTRAISQGGDAWEVLE